VNLDAAETTVRVNGAVTTNFRANEMLYNILVYIAAMTRYLTLYPGDVIWMVTDGKSPALKAGDVVEVEITGIGCPRNPFVAEER
jgi:2-keto-4-pentenoate hydratase/2-oxohepta-3-ene-1,7-dioic acid hydratase in catechol pathway